MLFLLDLYFEPLAADLVAVHSVHGFGSVVGVVEVDEAIAATLARFSVDHDFGTCDVAEDAEVTAQVSFRPLVRQMKDEQVAAVV